MAPNILILPAFPAALTLAVAAVSVGLAMLFARTNRSDIERQTGTRRARLTYRSRSRRARKIVAAVERIDAVLAEPDPKVTDSAELRAGLRRLLAVIAAERLAELSAIQARSAARPKRRFRLRRQ